MDPQEIRLSSESFVWALQVMSRAARKPFSPDIALHEFLPPYTVATLLLAAPRLGMKVGARHLPISELRKIDVPALVLVSELPSPTAPVAHSERDVNLRLALMLSRNEGAVHLLEEGGRTPARTEWRVMSERYRGLTVFFSPLPAAGADVDETALPSRQFGFHWFLPELLRYKHIWRDVILASLGIQLLGLTVPLFTQIVIDKVIAHHALSTLAVVAAALAVILVFNSSMGWLRQYLVLHTGNRVDATLGMQVFDHVLKLPFRYHERRKTGITVARIQGVETIREFLTGAAVAVVLDLPFLLLFLAVMLYYSPLLTGVAVAVIAAIAATSLVVTPLLRRRVNEQFFKGARNQAFVTEYLVGIETVKSLQMEPSVRGRFGEYFSAYLDAGFKTRRLAATYQAIGGALEQMLTLLVLCVGAWLVMQGKDFTVGMLVAFQMFASRLSQPMLRLVGLWQEFQGALIAVRRLADLMDAPVEPYADVRGREETRHGEIVINDLSFRYADHLPEIIKGFSFRVASGSVVAIVGRSGSGKSTLAKLLQNFYQPTRGSIAVGGRDIAHLSANELRRHLGVVPQETVLFSGSVYDNLVLASPHASFEQVVTACKMAGIHEFLEQLPRGYQTELGEHGTGLSGGQKQRLAIARALLKRPSILVFDEATSNLDDETAERFARTINTLKGKATILFITHHVPAALAVDKIVSLDDVRPRVEADPQRRHRDEKAELVE